MILQNIPIVLFLRSLYLLKDGLFLFILAAMVKLHVFIDSIVIEFLHFSCQNLTGAFVADEGDRIYPQLKVNFNNPSREGFVAVGLSEDELIFLVEVFRIHEDYALSMEKKEYQMPSYKTITLDYANFSFYLRCLFLLNFMIIARMKD